MDKNHVMTIQEALNLFRAVSAVNKEDMETAAARLQLDSSIQLNILWIVYCNEGIRITSIADLTFWHTSSVVIHVKKLMKEGYVTIEKSDQDGRVVNVYLTDRGRELIRKSYEIAPGIFKIAGALEKMSQRYSPAITQLFLELLHFLAVELHGKDKLLWIKESGEKMNEMEKQLREETATAERKHA